jgi:hypothetical protein
MTIVDNCIWAVGVTDPLKALFRNDNGISSLIMQGIGIRKCSNGIIVSNGSTCLINNASFYIDDINQNITNGIIVDGISTYIATFNIQAFYLPGIISSYTINPIQRVISAHNGANVHCIELIAKLEKEGVRELAICGGATIYTMFMKSEVVDSLYITIEPTIFGSGMKLFTEPITQNLSLVSTETKDSSVFLEYKVQN